jgi:hypothetical protein
VYILGTDDDRTNLQTAIRLRDLEPDARVVVRCSSDSAFIQQLAQAGGFEIFAISALLKTSFVDLHREWFR